MYHYDYDVLHMEQLAYLSFCLLPGHMTHTVSSMPVFSPVCSSPECVTHLTVQQHSNTKNARRKNVQKSEAPQSFHVVVVRCVDDDLKEQAQQARSRKQGIQNLLKTYCSRRWPPRI